MLRLLPAPLALIMMLAAQPVQGVVYAGGDGAGNDTAPANDFGFSNVGIRGSWTAVYLGNYGGEYWMLTAAHVPAGDVVLNGTNYSYVPGSDVLLTNEGTGLTGTPDLRLYRISSDPGLPTLAISATRPSLNSLMYMAGASPGRETDPSYWSVSDELVWTEVESTETYNVWGYKLAGAREVRWATNNLENTLDGLNNLSLNGYKSKVFRMDFDAVVNEGQVYVGDSGGGVFHKNGSTWELSGILVSRESYLGQPGLTAVFNNTSLAVDLSVYHDQIMAAVPESKNLGAIVAVTALAVSAGRRRVLKRQ